MAAERAPGRSLTIAGISLDVTGGEDRWPLATFPLFEGRERAPRDQWRMDIREASMPEIRGQLRFDSGESWAGHAVEEGEFDLVQFTRDQSGLRIPQSLLRISNRERHAMLFDTLGVGLSYPFDELFFLNAFSLNESLLVHSCAVERGGRGYVFCGVSGAGKSTLGAILAREGWNVLCDERNVVWRDSSGSFQLSSSPWYGGGAICRNETLPLAGIVALNPAHEGFSLERLPLEAAIGSVFTALFLPQFTPAGVERNLGTLRQLLLEVPVFRLNYAKDSVDIAGRLDAFSQGKNFSGSVSRSKGSNDLSLT